jgi:hypothetical protein
MKIADDHLYHGAALIQIAEDPQFTAINSFKLGTKTSRSAYRINDDIGVYLKYAGIPNKSHGEYVFQFREEHLAELAEIAKVSVKVFVALVCVKARHVCCLSYQDLRTLIEARKTAKGEEEDQYTMLVTAPENKSFRVYVNKPGVKNTVLGKPIVVSRTAFPETIFE